MRSKCDGSIRVRVHKRKYLPSLRCLFPIIKMAKFQLETNLEFQQAGLPCWWSESDSFCCQATQRVPELEAPDVILITNIATIVCKTKGQFDLIKRTDKDARSHEKMRNGCADILNDMCLRQPALGSVINEVANTTGLITTNKAESTAAPTWSHFYSDHQKVCNNYCTNDMLSKYMLTLRWPIIHLLWIAWNRRTNRLSLKSNCND